MALVLVLVLFVGWGWGLKVIDEPKLGVWHKVAYITANALVGLIYMRSILVERRCRSSPQQNSLLEADQTIDFVPDSAEKLSVI
jgi:hypothetical protein